MIPRLPETLKQHREPVETKGEAIVFNAFDGTFTARQSKFLDLKQNSFLGGPGHFHEYAEFYAVLNDGGEATFELKPVDDTAKKPATFTLSQYDTILVPRRVAHKAFGRKGTLLLGFSEQPFVSLEKSERTAVLGI